MHVYSSFLVFLIAFLYSVIYLCSLLFRGFKSRKLNCKRYEDPYIQKFIVNIHFTWPQCDLFQMRDTLKENWALCLFYAHYAHDECVKNSTMKNSLKRTTVWSLRSHASITRASVRWEMRSISTSKIIVI